MSYSGAVKSFVATKGYGFIECAETFNYYGKDIIVFKSDLPHGFASPGDQCQFSVIEEHNGPRAKDVMMTATSNRGYSDKGGFEKGHSKGKGKGGKSPPLPPPPPMMALTNGGYAAHMPYPPAGPVGPVDIYAPSFVGTVKSFNPKSGWGMIACDMTMQLYGKDVFFTTATAPPGGVSAGEQVRFSVKVEPKGPAAIEVTPLRMYTQSFTVPYHPGHPAAGFAAAPKGGSGKTPSKDHVYIGTVKSFNDEKGWGHISCNATMKIHNRDVFLMKGEVEAAGGNIPLGSLVSFKVQSDVKGPKAIGVRVIPADAVGSESYPGRQFTGTIKSFFEEKGWGFIAGEEILDVFGKDIFLNKREMEGHTPSLGDQVYFQVEIDKDGQAQAKSIQFQQTGYLSMNPLSNPTKKMKTVH